jgi:hypothetical protein
MGFLDSIFNPGKGYDKAQEELRKYYEQSQRYLEPYNKNGQSVFPQYSDAMNKLLNPTALQDEWSTGYKESDLAKQNEAMASQHGLNAAQAMGLGGSSPALQAIQSGTSGIVARDRQQYLDDIMKKYLAGIGIGQDIYGKGSSAASQQSTNANQMGENSSQLAFNKQNAPGGLFQTLLGLGAGIFGGPIGSALGAGLSQNFGWSPTGSYNPGRT